MRADRYGRWVCATWQHVATHAPGDRTPPGAGAGAKPHN